MRVCGVVGLAGVALLTGAVAMTACVGEAHAEEAGAAGATAEKAAPTTAPPKSSIASIPLLVTGILFSAGGVGASVAIIATQGPCGEVDDQCALNAMLLAPGIAGVFLGVPMMIAGAMPPEDDEDEEASLTPDIVVAPGGAGLSWRF